MRPISQDIELIKTVVLAIQIKGLRCEWAAYDLMKNESIMFDLLQRDCEIAKAGLYYLERVLDLKEQQNSEFLNLFRDGDNKYVFEQWILFVLRKIKNLHLLGESVNINADKSVGLLSFSKGLIEKDIMTK